MLRLLIHIAFLISCQQLLGQNAAVEFESFDQGMLLPHLSEDPNNNLSEGMLYYNTTIQHFKFYNGSMWDTINANGSDGVDGPSGAQGPQGEEGELVWFGLACWDTNQDGIEDASEDKNNNGIWDRNDCLNGGFGDSGAIGLPAFPATITAQPIGTSDCVVFNAPLLNSNPNLVILHTYRRTITDSYTPPLINLSYDTALNQWKVCSNDGSMINSSASDTRSFIDLLVIAELP